MRRAEERRGNCVRTTPAHGDCLSTAGLVAAALFAVLVHAVLVASHVSGPLTCSDPA